MTNASLLLWLSRIADQLARIADALEEPLRYSVTMQPPVDLSPERIRYLQEKFGAGDPPDIQPGSDYMEGTDPE